MKTYIIRDIEDGKWSLIKVLCSYNQITIKHLFHQMIDSAISEFVRTDFYKEMIKTHSKKEDG